MHSTANQHKHQEICAVTRKEDALFAWQQHGFDMTIIGRQGTFPSISLSTKNTFKVSKKCASQLCHSQGGLNTQAVHSPGR